MIHKIVVPRKASTRLGPLTIAVLAEVRTLSMPMKAVSFALVAKKASS